MAQKTKIESSTHNEQEVLERGFVLQCSQSGEYLQYRTYYPHVANLTDDLSAAALFSNKDDVVKYCLKAQCPFEGLLPIITDMKMVEVEVVCEKTVTVDSFVFKRVYEPPVTDGVDFIATTPFWMN